LVSMEGFRTLKDLASISVSHPSKWKVVIPARKDQIMLQPRIVGSRILVHYLDQQVKNSIGIFDLIGTLIKTFHFSDMGLSDTGMLYLDGPTIESQNQVQKYVLGYSWDTWALYSDLNAPRDRDGNLVGLQKFYNSINSWAPLKNIGSQKTFRPVLTLSGSAEATASPEHSYLMQDTIRQRFGRDKCAYLLEEAGGHHRPTTIDEFSFLTDILKIDKLYPIE